MHTYRFNVSEIIRQIIFSLLMEFSYRKEAETKIKKNDVALRSKTPATIIKFNFQVKAKNFFLSLINAMNAPRCGKYAVQSTFRNNQGAATIEAVCIMPVMIFVFWAFYSMGQIFMVENQIYQAAMNTADYLAEYAYLAEDTGLEILGYGAAQVKLRQYLPKPQRLEQYVTGGAYGIRITEPVLLDEEGFVSLHVQYEVQIPVPILGKLTMPMEVQVRQKAYTGYQQPEDSINEQRYVYLTEYSSVYHCSRECTHLKLTIIPVSATTLQTAYPNLDACEYCGKDTASVYYVTATGECYHSSLHCSGLKRTVRRVPFHEVQGYLPCSRCGY